MECDDLSSLSFPTRRPASPRHWVLTNRRDAETRRRVDSEVTSSFIGPTNEGRRRTILHSPFVVSFHSLDTFFVVARSSVVGWSPDQSTSFNNPAPETATVSPLPPDLAGRVGCCRDLSRPGGKYPVVCWRIIAKLLVRPVRASYIGRPSCQGSCPMASVRRLLLRTASFRSPGFCHDPLLPAA